jgi:hypothetical protein
MLSPVVKFTRSFDDLVMNGQSAAFAKGWKLGRWDIEDEKEIDASYATPMITSGKPRPNLPHYRDLMPPASAKRGQSFSRTRSDPNFLSNSEREKNPRFELPMDEPGVHGGYYTVRPNMEESMTFLKKLFSHQQGAGTTFHTNLSAPDSPVCK